MNWDRIESNWTQLKGQVREQWAKLTDDHIDAVGGNRDQLIRRIRETYGISQQETEKQVSAWERHQNQLKYTKAATAKETK